MNIKIFCSAIIAVLCLLNSFFCDVNVVNPDKELIFNAQDIIFDKITEPNKKYFTACPAVSDDELAFNETISISKNSLFLRDIVVPAEHTTPLVECEHSYKPSIRFNEAAEWFEIGYEVYVDVSEQKVYELYYVPRYKYLSTGQLITLKENGKLKNKLRRILATRESSKKSKSQNDEKNSNDSRDKKTIQTDVVSASKSNSDGESVAKNDNRDADGIKNESESKTKKNLESTYSFYPIRVFYFYFDVEKCGPRKIMYGADKGEFNEEYKCQEFSIDEALYENIDFKSIYKPINQMKLFEKLPAFPKLSTEKCGHKYGCLKPHQVIPHYYYHSQASKIATCAAVNTLPVWESISDGALAKIDQYLYVISQLWGRNKSIWIITGFTDVLSYPTRRSFNLFPRKLFMDLKNKKVPVPRIIYKILKLIKEDDVYFVIIVIHNDPVTEKIDHICPSQPGDKMYETLLASWSFFENKVTESGRSYPCPMIREVLDRLNVHRTRSNDRYYSTLLLDRFPSVGFTEEGPMIEEKKRRSDDENRTDEEKKQIAEKNRQLIEKKMVELFGKV